MSEAMASQKQSLGGMLPAGLGELVRPIGEVTGRPIGEVTERTIGEVTERSIGEVTARPIGEVTARPIGEVTARPIGEVTERSMGEVTPRPIGDVSEHPIGEVSARPIGEVEARPSEDVERPIGRPPGTGGIRWWPVILGAGAVALLVFGIRRGHHREPTDVNRPAVGARETEPYRSAAPEDRYREPERADRTTERAEVPTGSIASKLKRVLDSGEGANAALTGEIFRSGTATLSPTGQETLKEIATVLRGFPESPVTVTGGTAGAGEDSDARELAADRAKVVRRELSRNGVSGDRIGLSRTVASGRWGAQLGIQRY
jgi:outer membrane protein OmpA-like peptidoglycan-associated protein